MNRRSDHSSFIFGIGMEHMLIRIRISEVKLILRRVLLLIFSPFHCRRDNRRKKPLHVEEGVDVRRPSAVTDSNSKPSQHSQNILTLTNRNGGLTRTEIQFRHQRKKTDKFACAREIRD